MSQDVKWLFFDVGSTLVDESLVYENRMRYIAQTINVTYEYIYKSALKFYKRNQKGDLELFKLYNLEELEWNCDEEKLYVDTKECLKKLKCKYKIGIIANQSFGTTERLENFGILKYIDLVIASAEEGVAKPNKKIFEIALNKSGCEPNQAIMIGDRIDNDIVPAKALGMKTIWVKQGFRQYWNVQGEDESADLVVDNLTEIVAFLYK